MLTPLLMVAGVVSATLQDQVTIVATTDVHGRAMHWDYLHDREAPWGLTRAATAIDSIRRVKRDAVVLVDAGDLLQGNLFARYFATEHPVARHPIVDAFNFLRYDAFTPGNHDFDFGVELMDAALRDAQFHVVSANVYGPSRLAYREYAVVERSGIRVGITGGTTPGAAVWNRDKMIGRRTVRPILPEVSRALQQMQADGVDLKVVLLHSGLSGRSSYDPRGVGEENVAAQVAFLPVKPDVVVVGHSHRQMRDSVINGVHFIQAEPWAKSLAVAEISFTRNDQGKPIRGFVRGTRVDLARVSPHEELVRRLEDSHRNARSWGELPVATAQEEWSAQFARGQDTPIIDFVNHVQLHNTGAQLSATAVFNPEAGFRRGLVRVRHVLGLYPFENTLKVVAIDGATLKQYLERSAEYFRTYVPGQPPINSSIAGYNYDIVSGLEYVIDVTMPVGSRVRQMVFDGRIVQPTDRFSLAINDYRMVAGRFDMLSRLRVIRSGDRRVVEMLVDEVRRVGTLVTDSYFKPSWSVIPSDAREAIRISLGAPDPTRSERHAFRILATTDLRGSMQPRKTNWSGGAEVGGLSALKGWVDSLATACVCPSIVLDAGGAIGGSLIADRSFGRLMVDAMNVVRYDAAVIGERELMWGVDTLRARIGHARFPFLAANTRLESGTARPDWARDWVMIERGGARVAVIGLTGGPAMAIPLAESDRFIVDDMVATVERLLPQARASGAEFTVLLAHAGAYCEVSGCRGELIDFVNALQPGSVDLVIGGHSASEATATINGIPILLPGAGGMSLGVVDVFATPGGGHRVESSVQTVWADSVSVDEEIESLVRAASFDADAVLTTLGVPTSASPGEGESSLGRLVADAYRNAARAHVAIVHDATVEGRLPAGDVTYRQVYDVQPVRHQVRRVFVPGSVVEDVIEQALRGAIPSVHISGLHVEYDPNARPGDRVRRIRLDGDRGLNRGDMYWLAINDFMAFGGGGYSMLAGLESEPVGLSDFAALTQYLSRLPRPVTAPRVRRIRARQ